MSNEYTIKKTNPEGTKTRYAVQRVSKTNQPIGKAEIFSTEDAAKRYVASKSEVKESRTSSILKGILAESGERVSVVYIDDKPVIKYTNIEDAKEAVDVMKKNHPKKKYEIKQEMRESKAIKGADGKRCWKGKRYAGTVNGKDKCVPVKNEAANPAQQAAIAANMKKQGKKPKHVDEVDYGQGQRKYKAKPAGTIQDESSIMKGLTT